jgi:peroxisomal membrane protein 2
MKSSLSSLLLILATSSAVNGFALNISSSTRTLSTVSNTSTSPTRTRTRTRTALNVGAEVTDTLVNAWSSYNVALEQNPLITKSITAGVILGAADLAGQKLENYNKEQDVDFSIDFGRFIRFGFFGFILQAPWNHFYYLFLDGALPPTVDPFTATTGIKVFIDQFIQAPIFTVIIFFFLGLLEGKSIDDVKGQLERDYKDTMLANWKLWVPATFLNIAFCPPMLRVLFLNCVFFFWSIFLSIKLNKEDGEEV